MGFHDIWSVVAGVILSLGGGAAIVLAFSSWLGKVWANRLMESDKAKFARDLKAMEATLSRTAEDRRRKVEGLMQHYERQIEEFYGPLFNSVHQIFLANDVQSAILDNITGDAAEPVRDYFYETYFRPLHNDVQQVLRTKLYLVEGRDIPDSFYRYLQHAAQERDQRTLWKQFRIDTTFLKGQPWPGKFYKDVKTGLERAMRNHEDCLDGLKA
jgi:hypothetical protein